MAEPYLTPRSDDKTQDRKTSRARSRERRKQKRRARDIRRVALASGFVTLEIVGFWLANFAVHDSWIELFGFLLLQPLQILLNLLDAQFQLTRGMRDADAVLLVTLLSLPLNVSFWYVVWRGVRKLRRRARRKRYAPGSPFGPAPLPARALAPRSPVPLASHSAALAPTAVHPSSSPATSAEAVPLAPLRE